MSFGFVTCAFVVLLVATIFWFVWTIIDDDEFSAAIPKIVLLICMLGLEICIFVFACNKDIEASDADYWHEKVIWNDGKCVADSGDLVFVCKDGDKYIYKCKTCDKTVSCLELEK